MAKAHVPSLNKYSAHKKGIGCATKCNGGWSESHHGSYRYKGYKATKDEGYTPIGKRGKAKKSGIYNISYTNQDNSYALKQMSCKPPKKSEDWHIGIGGADKKGRKPFYRQASYPFKQNTHHILPATSLHHALKTKELRWLIKAEYNLNDGINLIILPKKKSWADMLNLPDHPGGHQKYNDAVKELVNGLKQKVKEEEGKHELEEEDLKKLKDDLEKWEDRHFSKIRKWGEDDAREKYINAINAMFEDR